MEYRIKILPNEHGKPPGKLADAELYFATGNPSNGNWVVDAATSLVKEFGGDVPDWLREKYDALIDALEEYQDPLAGLKLIGFGVWERRGGGGRNVNFPARSYAIQGERRSFALLRPVEDNRAQERLRDAVLEAYAKYEAARSGG